MTTTWPYYPDQTVTSNALTPSSDVIMRLMVTAPLWKYVLLLVSHRLDVLPCMKTLCLMSHLMKVEETLWWPIYV